MTASDRHTADARSLPIGLRRARVAALIADLAERRLTVATAESLTGGLLVATLTAIPGSSTVVRGGLVCYATDLKARLAGVDADLLARAGAVDPEVAAQLAIGARERCGAAIGVGLTGVAGPDPQDGKPVGTVYVAVATAAETVVEPIPTDGLILDRDHIRAAAVAAAVDLTTRVVCENASYRSRNVTRP